MCPVSTGQGGGGGGGTMMPTAGPGPTAHSSKTGGCWAPAVGELDLRCEVAVQLQRSERAAAAAHHRHPGAARVHAAACARTHTPAFRHAGVGRGRVHLVLGEGRGVST